MSYGVRRLKRVKYFGSSTLYLDIEENELYLERTVGNTRVLSKLDELISLIDGSREVRSE